MSKKDVEIVPCEIQTASSRNSTRVIVSIFYDYDPYSTSVITHTRACAHRHLCIYIYIEREK